ncbi:major facilitator superfamily domain-containing protein [Paraphysoderma sedebokerense]|nr:major facilitator superfamily domain-containing protein [Paraphysoderma sedebokerense]
MASFCSRSPDFRLWGTIACGLTTPFVGWLLSMTNTTNPSGQLENDYRVMYFVYVFATLIFSILACFSPLGSVTVELKQKEKRLRTRTRSRLPSTTQIELLSNNESLKSSPHFSAELGSSPLRIPQFPITESNVRVRSTTCPQVERPNSTFPSGYSPLPQTSTESSPSRSRNRPRIRTITTNSADELIAIPSDDYQLLPAESHIESEFEITEEPEEPEPLLNTLLVLLSGKIVLVFLFVMLCNGIGNSVISNFYWIYLMDYIGVDEKLLGLTVPFRIILEIPFFYYANKILRLYSLRTAIILPHITTIIRLLCYSFLPKHASAWIILPIELFHGISYALFFAAAVQFGAIIAPRGGESTVQSLITGTYATLGGGIGALLGGFLLERTSGFVLWFSTAMLILASLALFVIIKVEEFSDKDSVFDEFDDENEWDGVRGETEYLRLSQDDEVGVDVKCENEISVRNGFLESEE